MKSAVIVFPGSNCDRDLAVAIETVTGQAPNMLWHRETEPCHRGSSSTASNMEIGLAGIIVEIACL